jgi:hypothetical protein
MLLAPRIFFDAMIIGLGPSTEESVFVSHFMAINALLRALQGQERLVTVHLPHASCTTLSSGLRRP